MKWQPRKGEKMKKVNWESSRVRNLVDGETPFMEIDLPERRAIRLWWTKGGAYGPQVMAILYGDEDALYTVTDGCGYSKTHAALEECFRELGRAPRGFERHDQDLHRYRVGGNYYRVPVKDWMVWK
jgi:hypothetical protein